MSNLQESLRNLKIQLFRWILMVVLISVIWNFWLHKDPWFFLNFFDPSRTPPSPLPTLPWLAVLLIVGMLVFFYAESRRSERAFQTIQDSYDARDRAKSETKAVAESDSTASTPKDTPHALGSITRADAPEEE